VRADAPRRVTAKGGVSYLNMHNAKATRPDVLQPHFSGKKTIMSGSVDDLEKAAPAQVQG
jgi:hypothetical protein